MTVFTHLPSVLSTVGHMAGYPSCHVTNTANHWRQMFKHSHTWKKWYT